MTTDPPPSDFEDVRIDHWQTRLPSAICTNKEIFNEIFSLETWKTVLKSDQRDRIMKLLPAEVLKTPGAAQQTIEDLFSKSLTNFGSNPLDTLFDSLENGHHDPVVVETKACIVREWRRESRRLMKSYHTKLLQDIVISREKHLKKLDALVSKKNGKKSVTALQNTAYKRNGKPDTNGVALVGGKTSNNKSHQGPIKTESAANANSTTVTNILGRNVKANEQVGGSSSRSNNKRGRAESISSSPPSSKAKDKRPSHVEGPAKKKTKQSQPTNKKAASNKKSKPGSTSSPISSSPGGQDGNNSSLLFGNMGATPTTQSTTSMLLGTLTTGSSPMEPPTLSLRSPSSAPSSAQQQSTLLTPSLLESLISPPPLVPAHLLSGKGGDKQISKLFPSPVLPITTPVTSSSQSSFLQSPVQSSPILASQLQAPSPISVNLSTLTSATLGSSRSDSIIDSPSNSSITLNYTQTPPPTTPQPHMKGLIGEDSSSDEFEFESIEPTIGFSGPSTFPSSRTSANIKTLTSSSASAAVSALATPDYKRSTTTTADIQNSQKCSLLTNCLTQPLSANSSNAAVSAALANNILTSTPVPVSTAMMGGGGGNGTSSSTIHHQPQLPAHKLFVTNIGAGQQHQQQLQKFLPQPSQQKLASPQQLSNINVFQQKNVITSTPSQTVVDPQGLVSSLVNSKDILATFGASIPTVETTSLHQVPQHSISNPDPTVNAQGGLSSSSQTQQQVLLKREIKQEPPDFDEDPTVSLHGEDFLLGLSRQAQHQMISLQSGQLTQEQSIILSEGGGPLPGVTTSLNSQNLQLPSTMMSTAGENASTLGKTTSLTIPSTVSSASPSSLPNLLDGDDLGLNLGSFGLGAMGLDMGGSLPELDSAGIGGVVGSIDSIKLELDKIDDLSGVLDGNPFDSIPNLSDDLDGLDLDMVDGLCDFEVLLSDEKQYASFFSLIRDVLCSTKDHRMTLVCMDKAVRKWSISAAATLNPWYMRVSDWNNALIVALNFLAGNYQDVHPEDFVPYIEYKYKTKYYQWIGAGRDGDNNLIPLCTLWLDNLDKLPPLKKSDGDLDEPEEEDDENEDSDSGGLESSDSRKKNKRPQTPPPPRCTTEWTVRPSSEDERELFREQEKCRFDNPHKAFTYRMHGYESVVGPVKGVYSSQTGITNKARGHSLLVDDRPPFVTILALVRDAVARLPNGEGTRSDICEMLRDSTFLAPEASNVTLNSVVSGALDRLHYERDPCVRYDSHKKSWIYLHRDRTQEQFERLHHNRSYTKSTKTRHHSSRKSRKSSSKSSSSSTASTPATPAPTTIITVNTSTSQSSSSSQSSVEAIVKPPLSTTTSGTAASGAVSTTSGGSVVTLPPLSTINPNVQTLTTPTVLPGGKQAIGLVSVSAAPNVQLQQQTLQTAANRGLVTFPTSSESQQSQPSLNEILAAAAGLRFQPTGGAQGASIVLNQGPLGAAPGNAAATRLILQQPPPGSAQQQPTVLMQQPQQQSAGVSGAAIAPGQILLSPQAAVLKLAGNIRIGEGLRFTQLRLPTAGATAVGSPMPGTQSPLRLPQHRILLARGALPGQPQTQGVLLGQTSTGQTVILSAGPAGAGTTLAGFQQALNSGVGNGNAGQITMHAAPPPQAQLQTVQQQDAVATSTASSNSCVTQQTVQSQQVQQALQSAVNAAQMQTFAAAANKSPPKFGIITNVPHSNSSGIVVTSSAATTTGSSLTSLRASFSGSSRGNSVGPATTSTLPPTSIALPASILAPAQPQPVALSSSPSSVPLGNSTTSSALTAQQQQQIILTTMSGGGMSANQHQQSQAPLQGNTTTSTLGVNTAGGVQLQSLAQTLGSQSLQQLKQPPQQSFILQPQQNSASGAQQLQGMTLGQGQGQLAAPIIIRSAQGEFVSFGIPSNLSLGRGVPAGIKVIPFQTAGNKTVLARIVAPSSTSGLTTVSATATSPVLVTSGTGGNLLSTVTTPSSASSVASPTLPAQILTMSSGSPGAQFSQVLAQPQQQQSNSGYSVSSSAPSSTANGGMGTITLSAAVTSASTSPVGVAVVTSQNSNASASSA